MKKTFLIAALLLSGAGCMATPEIPLSHHEMPADPHLGHVMPAAGNAQPAGERLVLKETPGASGMGTIAFVLLDPAGMPLTPERLAVAHEKKLHVIVARDNLKEYRHLHPEFSEGLWRVESAVLGGADYFLYADFVPVGGEPEVLQTTFRVGTRVHSDPPLPDGGERKSDGDASATMQQEGEHFIFTLRQNEVAPKGLRPYLGAYGHVVILKYDAPEVYVHAHPMSDAKPLDGTVVFMGALSGPGRYTAFAQFDIDGTIRTFSFTFDQA